MDNYYDLGTHTRTISTESAECQLWFNRGLNWLFGYNFGEAVKCFEKAADADPNCVMAQWGIANGLGCNYNKEWNVFGKREIPKVLAKCRAAIAQGQAHAQAATPLENSLLAALAQRFQGDGERSEEELCAWNDDYANAMREVYALYADDWDVAMLFAEALINRTPWQLWHLPTGTPAEGASTLEAIEVLERGLAQVETSESEPHPGLLHIHIHVMEMSPHPEKAWRSADILRELVPHAGHLKHMPSHIDILCGDYQAAVAANNKAHIANNLFLEREGDLNEYTFYRAHDIHFKLYAAMLLGQYKTSMQAATELQALAHDDLLHHERPPMAYTLEGFVSMKIHVLVRFGRWQEIIDEPMPSEPDLYCVTVAMLHYGKGIAHAALGDFVAADKELTLFKAAQGNLHKHRYIFNNTAADILLVAEAMLNGEIEYHRGNYEGAFEQLRHAVHLDDNLAYQEPWGWMMPTRHALGALLLEQGHVDEALAVYRADLGLDDTLSRPLQHPNNVWSLKGYVACLEKQGNHEAVAALRIPLDLALARADVPIEVSCFCAMGDSGDCCE